MDANNIARSTCDGVAPMTERVVSVQTEHNKNVI